MNPEISFSITTAENGWIVRRIDSHPEGPHGKYVFTSWDQAQSHLLTGLDYISAIREKERSHE